MSEIPLIEGMQINANLAMKHAMEYYEIDLDYSEESIAKVELILSAIYKETKSRRKKHSKGGLSDKELWILSLMYGCYIGEIFRRQLGGSWIITNPLDKGDTFTLEIGKHHLFPPNKVMKRLKDGPADDVYFYYKVMKKSISENTPMNYYSPEGK